MIMQESLSIYAIFWYSNIIIVNILRINAPINCQQRNSINSPQFILHKHLPLSSTFLSITNDSREHRTFSYGQTGGAPPNLITNIAREQ